MQCYYEVLELERDCTTDEVGVFPPILFLRSLVVLNTLVFYLFVMEL